MLYPRPEAIKHTGRNTGDVFHSINNEGGIDNFTAMPKELKTKTIKITLN